MVWSANLPMDTLTVVLTAPLEDDDKNTPVTDIWMFVISVELTRHFHLSSLCFDAALSPLLTVYLGATECSTYSTDLAGEKVNIRVKSFQNDVQHFKIAVSLCMCVAPINDLYSCRNWWQQIKLFITLSHSYSPFDYH